MLLLSFARIQGIKNLKRNYEKEIEMMPARCDREFRTKKNCDSLIQEIKDELKKIEKLDKQFMANPTNPSVHNIYYATILYQQLLKKNVLNSEYEKWNKECSSPTKVNTDNCKFRFFEISHLDELCRSLSLIAAQRIRKQDLQTVEVTNLKIQIEKYEK